MILVLITGLQSDIFSEFEDTLIEKLTSENFNEFLDASPVVVLFFTDWSQRSKDFTDKYISIASELEGLITFGAIDCDDCDEICEEYELRDFPSLIIFEDKVHRLYEGEKTADAILSTIYGKENFNENYFVDFGAFVNETDRGYDNYSDYDSTGHYNDNNNYRTTESYPNSSHVLKSSCVILFLTIIANIICY